MQGILNWISILFLTFGYSVVISHPPFLHSLRVCSTFLIYSFRFNDWFAPIFILIYRWSFSSFPHLNYSSAFPLSSSLYYITYVPTMINLCSYFFVPFLQSLFLATLRVWENYLLINFTFLYCPQLSFQNSFLNFFISEIEWVKDSIEINNIL